MRNCFSTQVFNFFVFLYVLKDFCLWKSFCFYSNNVVFFFPLVWLFWKLFVFGCLAFFLYHRSVKIRYWYTVIYMNTMRLLFFLVFTLLCILNDYCYIVSYFVRVLTYLDFIYLLIMRLFISKCMQHVVFSFCYILCLCCIYCWSYGLHNSVFMFYIFVKCWLENLLNYRCLVYIGLLAVKCFNTLVFLLSIFLFVFSVIRINGFSFVFFQYLVVTLSFSYFFVRLFCFFFSLNFDIPF